MVDEKPYLASDALGLERIGMEHLFNIPYDRREANGGRQCCQVGCGMVKSRTTNRLWARTDADCGSDQSLSCCYARDDIVVATVVRRCTVRRASGTCTFSALACRLLVQPILKHRPRSLTCIRVNGRVNPYGVRKLIGGIP
ncbi:hypothetical protein Sjap_026027 [Stephania japonica]|uniref:Uncharacterized protein n=1 Tax=Stephania japonica TaxID=461633 RepID=A0AAP0E2U3_9MAGN